MAGEQRRSRQADVKQLTEVVSSDMEDLEGSYEEDSSSGSSWGASVEVDPGGIDTAAN